MPYPNFSALRYPQLSTLRQRAVQTTEELYRTGPYSYACVFIDTEPATPGWIEVYVYAACRQPLPPAECAQFPTHPASVASRLLCGVDQTQEAFEAAINTLLVELRACILYT